MSTGSQHDLERYVYQPIEGRSKIRILHLESSTQEELSCTIEHIDVNTSSYSALSYAWGNLEKPFLMIVKDRNGKLEGCVPLTRNLNSAIHDLRGATELQPKTFWIDQISINQEDTIERGQQVTLMSQVYSNALQVITYLGPEEPLDHDAIALSIELHEIFKDVYRELLITRSWRQDYRDPWRQLAAKVPKSHAGWSGINALAWGSWTTRLWV